MSNLHTREHWIDTVQGKLFAQEWAPLQAQGAPIVLLHDSLGCVALWREFPAQLAQTTGHRVIAYDRLGFGRSDAHPGSLRACCKVVAMCRIGSRPSGYWRKSCSSCADLSPG